MVAIKGKCDICLVIPKWIIHQFKMYSFISVKECLSVHLSETYGTFTQASCGH